MIKFNLFLRYKKPIIVISSILLICIVATLLLTCENDKASPVNKQASSDTITENVPPPFSENSSPPKNIEMLQLQDAFDYAAFKVDDRYSFNIEKLDQFIFNSENSKSDAINVINYYSDENHNKTIKDWYYLTCENQNIMLYGYYKDNNDKFTYDNPIPLKKIIKKVMPDGVNYRLSIDDTDTNTAKFFYANNPVLLPKTASGCVKAHLDKSRSGVLLYYLSSHAKRSSIVNLVIQSNWYLGVSSPHMSSYKIISEKEVDGKYIVDVQETWEVGGQDPSIQNVKFTVINEEGRLCIDSSSPY